MSGREGGGGDPFTPSGGRRSCSQLFFLFFVEVNPIGGRGGQIPLRGVFKTTPPTVRVQCQNFKNFGKREKRPYNALYWGFCPQIIVVILHKTALFRPVLKAKTALYARVRLFLWRV